MEFPSSTAQQLIWTRPADKSGTSHVSKGRSVKRTPESPLAVKKSWDLTQKQTCNLGSLADRPTICLTKSIIKCAGLF